MESESNEKPADENIQRQAEQFINHAKTISTQRIRFRKLLSACQDAQAPQRSHQ